MQMIQSLYYFMVLALFFGGISFVYDGLIAGETISYGNAVKTAWRTMRELLKSKEQDPVFAAVGIRNLSARKYSCICGLITIGLLALSLFQFLLTREFGTSCKTILLAIVLYFASMPKDYIFFNQNRYRTPFRVVMDLISKSRHDAMDEELTAVISQAKNLIVSWEGQTRSAEYILSRLIPYTHVTRQIFLQTQFYILQGRIDEAAEFFDENFGTKLGKDFSRILLKLDQLPPQEFLEQMNVLMSNIAARRETKKEQKLQRAKMIIFLLASAELLLIIFDFLYIILYDCMMLMDLAL